jgi:hypothetical protein
MAYEHYLYGQPDESFTNWTDWINQQNPEADPDKPYVQTGTTGGALANPDGTSYETIGPGSSVTPERAKSEYDKGVQVFGQSETEDFLRRNPGDFHRIVEALGSERSGGQQGSSRSNSPTQAWNSQPSNNGSRDALMQLLMQRAQQGSQVGATDPNVRAQVDPAVAQQQRESRRYLDDVAERSGPLANLQGERRLVSERQGQAAGQLEAQVIGREIAARRDEIAQALAQWGAMLSDEQRIALQRELGYLDDATRRYGIDMGADTARYGIDTQMDQFLRDLALREYDVVNRWDPTNPLNIP